jgi:hypothetical protein
MEWFSIDGAICKSVGEKLILHNVPGLIANSSTQYTFLVIAAVQTWLSFGSVNGGALWGSGRATAHDDLGASDVGSIIGRQV